MSTIETMITVDPDGSAHIDTPTGLPAGRHRVLLLVTDERDIRNANGWPLGFFAQTYGSVPVIHCQRLQPVRPRNAEALV